MAAPKLVLHSTAGYRPELDRLVADWVKRGVKYVGIYGVDASRVEDIIDELCVGNGSEPYFMLTASHPPSEGREDALALAGQISEEHGSGIEEVEF
jgi:hypothetical protein